MLNGESLGRQPVIWFRAALTVPYPAGSLEAIAYDAGVESGRTAVRSADSEHHLVVTADRKELHAESGDLSFLAIEILDARGTVVTNAGIEVSVEVSGNGVLEGLGSAQPLTTELYTDNVHTTFEGRAQAIVRALTPGPIRVEVSGTGFPSSIIELESHAL